MKRPCGAGERARLEGRGCERGAHADGSDPSAHADLNGLAEFKYVAFKRGEWKSFDTYATDFLANTAALPGAVVGAYSRIRAACWAYGNGWSLRALWAEWSTHAGTEDRSALEAALSELERRGVVIVARGDVELTIADPAMHANLLRKELARERKGSHRERIGARQDETSREKSREKSRGTSVLPPSPSSTSVPLPEDPPRSASSVARDRVKTEDCQKCPKEGDHAGFDQEAKQPCSCKRGRNRAARYARAAAQDAGQKKPPGRNGDTRSFAEVLESLKAGGIVEAASPSAADDIQDARNGIVDLDDDLSGAP